MTWDQASDDEKIEAMIGVLIEAIMSFGQFDSDELIPSRASIAYGALKRLEKDIKDDAVDAVQLCHLSLEISRDSLGDTMSHAEVAELNHLITLAENTVAATIAVRSSVEDFGLQCYRAGVIFGKAFEHSKRPTVGRPKGSKYSAEKVKQLMEKLGSKILVAKQLGCSTKTVERRLDELKN